MHKKYIDILKKLELLIYLFGIILLVCFLYQAGKIHGTMNTVSNVIGYKEVCEESGVYNNISNTCDVNCDNESNYFVIFNNLKVCAIEKPTFRERLQILIITGKYFKEKDIYLYIDKVGLAS